MMIEANQFSICMMEVYTDFSTGLRKCFKMLDAGIASASMHTVSNGQVRVLDSCVREVAQHFCTTEMLNTIAQINLAGHKETL